jgi:hypothetical protein
MATPQVQIIPASSSYRYGQPHFDESQFSRTTRHQQTKLSYADRAGMHTFRRKAQQERRLPTPEWALNDEQLRILLVRFMEARAFVPECARTGTLEERLEYAEMKMASGLPRLQARLRNFVREYERALNEVPRDEAGRFRNREGRLDELEREIKNTDTQIVLLTKRGGMAGTILRVVHLYHRLGWNSVDVAKEAGLCPPHVHQILYQMAHKAEVFLGEH